MGNDVGGPISARSDGGANFFGSSPRMIHTGGMPPATSAAGTDSTPVVTETYIAELPVRAPVRSTGFAAFQGSVAAGNCKAILYDKDGKVIASSASTAVSGTDTYQRIPWSAPINLRPGVYYVGMQYNNTSNRNNNHPFGNFGASKKTGEVFGTATTITPPTTFTADVGPMGSLY